MRPAIEAVRSTGTAVAEVALCYTGDLTSPAERLYTLDYYLRLAEQIVESGAHILAIKDMAGLLRAPAARKPGHGPCARGSTCRCTCTPTTRPVASSATLLAAIEAGVDAVDVASASMAGTTSQPPMSALVAATDGTPRATGPRPGRGVRPGAVLGGGPTPLRPLRVRPGLAHRARVHPRDPRRPAVEPAPAGHRPRASATASRPSRTCMPRPTGSSATSSR